MNCRVCNTIILNGKEQRDGIHTLCNKKVIIKHTEWVDIKDRLPPKHGFYNVDIGLFTANVKYGDCRYGNWFNLEHYFKQYKVIRWRDSQGPLDFKERYIDYLKK